MDIILSTGCLYKYSLPEIFQIAKAAGFDGIELLISRNNCNIGTDRIRELSGKYDIPILSLHSPFVICDGWGGFWDRIRKSLSIAIELSIPLVNFHPPSGLVFRYHLDGELSERIRTYKDLVKDSGIVLTIENLPTIRTFRRFFTNRLFPRMINNIYQIAEFTVNNDIFFTFDTTHIGTTGIDLLKAYAVFRGTIANIHLSDYDGRWQHLLPGTGYLPLEKLLAQVKRDGYNGIITLETCPAAMEHEDKVKAFKNAEAGLNYIRDALRRGE
jgi:sugar phosphate isomerase/epimerase